MPDGNKHYREKESKKERSSVLGDGNGSWTFEWDIQVIPCWGNDIRSKDMKEVKEAATWMTVPDSRKSRCKGSEAEGCRAVWGVTRKLGKGQGWKQWDQLGGDCVLQARHDRKGNTGSGER